MLIAEIAPANFSLDDVYAASFGILILRVGIGLALAAHGYNKFFGGGRIPGTARWFESIGMRKGTGRICAIMAASAELGCGLLIAVGLLTPLAAAGMISVMIVAGWVVHRPNGFFSANDGYELNFVFALAALAVATVGAGKYSLDHVIGISYRFNGAVGFAIALAVGIVGAVVQLATFYEGRPAQD